MALTTAVQPARARGAAQAAGSRGRRTGRGSGRSAPYVFMTPWMLGAVLLTIGPMLYSLYLSFTDYDLFGAPSWIGLGNYREMVSDPQFWASAWVTVRYVLLSAPLKLALALGVALLLARPRKGLGFYRSAFYAPSLLGASVSVALVWRALFSDGGTVDRGLDAVGVHTGGWVDNPSYALYTLVLLAVWQFGAPMVIFLAGLKQIPPELYEAASLDGAGPWRRFRSVTLPMLSPVIFFNLVLEIIHAFQAFTGAFVVSGGRGGPANSTLFYTLYLYQKGFTDFEMGYASALAWVLLAVVGIATLVVFKTANFWVFYTAEEK
ncbi:carbohydrate ABC transporter permease [Luteimicrobium sp. DT211]|uniref:carbohydrate ABC transporter permease n=1 Tax=Luteimicrobium sp. DT211 TaxID=3393412 RepID=UPI003CEE12B1